MAHKFSPAVTQAGLAKSVSVLLVTLCVAVALFAAYQILYAPEQPSPAVAEQKATQLDDVVAKTEPQTQAPEPKESEAQLEEVSVATPIEAPSSEPEAPSEVSLPSLDDATPVVVASLEERIEAPLLDLLVNDDLVRRVVVFVDNLADGKVAKKHTPVVAPTESFSVIEGDIIIMDPKSYERYTPYVTLLEQLSSEQIVSLFERYQPLLTQAYEEIGYEKPFKNTLIQAIDLMLATPSVNGSVPLVSQSVTYKYAYSEWEQLPSAQKQLLRMGPENAAKVKQVLKQVRSRLVKSESD